MPDTSGSFQIVRSAITGRKFTAEESYRLRDLIRLATIPEPETAPATDPAATYPPEEEWETAWFEKVKKHTAGIHLSKEHVAELKSLFDKMEIRPNPPKVVQPHASTHSYSDLGGYEAYNDITPIPSNIPTTDSPWEQPLPSRLHRGLSVTPHYNVDGKLLANGARLQINFRFGTDLRFWKNYARGEDITFDVAHWCAQGATPPGGVPALTTAQAKVYHNPDIFRTRPRAADLTDSQWEELDR